MTVVSDTTAISNLLLIDQLRLLKALFGKVLLPQQVLDELAAVEGFKEAIKQTDYITIVECPSILGALLHNESLDEGEKAAISYAVSNRLIC